MANSFGIPEVTLNVLGDSTAAINASTRLHPYQPLVVRVTNSIHDGGANATTEALLESDAALYVSQRHGEPWVLNGSVNTTTQIIHQAASTPAVPTNTTTLFPNFDYSTFE